MSLLFNILSRFVIAFLSRSKSLLISWLQSLSTVLLELKKIKSVTVSTVSPFICHEVLGDGEGQGSLACCSPMGLQRVRHEWLTAQQLFI